MRIVRSGGGNLSLVLGEFTLQDCPYPLFDAVMAGFYFIAFDEWDEEDRPPKSIWLDEERLRSHVEGIRRKHKAGAEGEDAAEGPLEQNTLIKDLVADG